VARTGVSDIDLYLSMLQAKVRSAARSLFGAAPVFKSTSGDLFDRFSLDQTRAHLLVFKDHRGRPYASDVAPSTRESILAWLRVNKLPILAALTPDKYKDYFGDDVEGLVVMGVLSGQARNQQAIERLKNMAREWSERRRENVKFIWVTLITSRSLNSFDSLN
jgi:Thioredoxin-like domain